MTKWSFAVLAVAALHALRIENRDGSSTAQASLPRWNAVVDLRLNEAHNPDFAFDFIVTMGVNARGEMAVRRRLERAVDLIDSSGSLVRRIGRRGTGPGEYQSIDWIGFIGDTLFVRDWSLKRFVAVTPSGATLRTFPSPQLPTMREFESTQSVIPLIGGTFVVARPYLDRDRTDYPLVVADSGGKIVKELTRLQPGPVFLKVTGPWSVGYQPFTDRSLWQAYRGGTGVAILDRKVSSGAARFRLRSLSPTGEVRFDRYYAYAPIAISRAEVDSVVRLAEYMYNNDGGDPGVARIPPPKVDGSVFRKGLYVPRHRPAVTALVAARDGTTWIRREEVHPESVLWNVIDQRGDMVAEVELPRSFQLFDAAGDHLWGVNVVENGVQEVVRYRVPRSPPRSPRRSGQTRR